MAWHGGDPDSEGPPGSVLEGVFREEIPSLESAFRERVIWRTLARDRCLVLACTFTVALAVVLSVLVVLGADLG